MNPYYAFSVPVFIKQLGGLKNVIEKSRAIVNTIDGGEAAFLNASLAPDMFPFVKQVRIACDNAKGTAARLAGVEIPLMSDDETTLDQLDARIDAVIAFLNTLTEAQFEGAAGVKVELPYFPGKHMVGADYLPGYALPNFLFHVTTAYDIARMKGAALGKADYMNGVPLRDN